jgi:DNA-binding CsgD family transcriptional regulator
MASHFFFKFKIMNLAANINMSFFRKNASLILYAFGLALLFLFLKLAEYKWLIIDHSTDIYSGAVALLFLLLGIWIASKTIQPKKEIQIVKEEIVVEKEILVEKEKLVPAPASFILNKEALQRSAITERELEVLQLIAKGLSNEEIAQSLFLSVNTIKTHVSNLFFKLDASRRTQAVEKAKFLCIIP